MSISRQEFNQQCIEFVGRCKGLNEKWVVSQIHQGNIVELNDRDVNCKHDEELVLMKTSIELDDETKYIRTCEYSVVYSESYEVPVMYFSSSNQDGEPLGFDTSLSKIHAQEAGQINQVEHPLLFRPFYMVHPCKTRNFMETHKKNNAKNYLLSWLSIIGTLLNLKLDLGLANKDE